MEESMLASKLQIQTAFTRLKTQRPLVVNITNFVVMNNTANALLALGASPIMAHSQKEMSDMIDIAGALVINMGTLDTQWIARMKYAITLAVEKGTPVVFDPVGCGASQLRTHTARQLCELAAPLKNRFTVRCNASEMLALESEYQNNNGVDSRISSHEAVECAQALHARLGCEVVISGATDHVIAARRFSLHDGAEMMTRVTGMGCTLSALTGAFAALDEPCSPGLAASAVMGVAGKLAAQKSVGPGSFQVHLLDILYQLTPETLMEHLTLNAC